MKKRIGMLLCTAVLTLSLTVAPAMASGGPFYPIKVEEYTYGPLDELRVSKVYQLSLSDDPSGIPTEDFERNGRRYYLLDMIREDDVGVDTQEYTDTITMDSDTKDLSAILKKLEPHREVTTEDGYTGLLTLDYTSVEVKAKGYKTSTKSLSATRTYPNLSDADVSFVPKTITDNGHTLTLGAVEWSNGENGYYTATASYTGTSSSQYATGYTVTANYTGQVNKTECNVVIYTATFGSEKLPEEEKDPAPSPELETPAPDAALTGTGVTVDPLALLLAILGGGGGLVAMTAITVLWITQKRQERKLKS